MLLGLVVFGEEKVYSAIRYSSCTNMRSYIFTQSEKEVLYEWLKGGLHREESALLHTTLGRLRRNESKLLDELRLLILATRRLHSSPKIRRREGDRDTTLTINPIKVHVANLTPPTYVKLIELFLDAQRIANNHRIAPKHRLTATKIAAEIGSALTGTDEKRHHELVAELEELKKELIGQSENLTSFPH